MTFDIDANGILEVTAIHRASKRKQGITIDSRNSGTLSKAEIEKLVEKADEMKKLDEVEDNRILAMTRLSTLCNQIEYDSQSNENT